MALINAFLAERAIAIAFASLPESEERITHWELHRPSPGQKSYPSAVNDVVYSQALIGGLVCGLLAGCALAATGRTRKILAATAVVISIVLSTLIVSEMKSVFDTYVEHIQARIEELRG